MTVALVLGSTKGVFASSASPALSRPAGVGKTGDLVIVGMHTAGKPTISTPNGWTTLTTLDPSGGSTRYVVLWRWLADGDGSSWTIGLSAANAGSFVTAVVTGANRANPIGQMATAVGSGTSANTAGPVTTAQANDLLLMLVALDSNTRTLNSWTAPLVELQEQADGGRTNGLAAGAQAVAGASGTKTATGSGNDRYAAALLYIAGQPDISALADNFDDNSLDAAKWQSASSAQGSATEVRCEIKLALSSTATGVDHAALQSANLYNLASSSLFVRLRHPIITGAAGQVLTQLNIFPESGGAIRFQVDGDGSISVEDSSGGTRWSALYDPLVHRWLKIEHDGTNLIFSTSTSGQPGTWTVRVSYASPFSASDLDSVRVTFHLDWLAAAATGAEQRAYFDCFNVSPPSAASQVDTFDDNALSTALWFTASAQVVEANQRLEMTVPSGAATAHAVATIVDASLAASAVFVRLASVPTSGDSYAYLQVANRPGSDGLRIFLDNLNNQVYAQPFQNSAVGSPTRTVRLVDAPRWFRVREAGGRIYADYATVGSPNNWTNLGSWPLTDWEDSMGFDQVLSTLVVVGNGTVAANRLYAFDDFNVVQAGGNTKFVPWFNDEAA